MGCDSELYVFTGRFDRFEQPGEGSDPTGFGRFDAFGGTGNCGEAGGVVDGNGRGVDGSGREWTEWTGWTGVDLADGATAKADGADDGYGTSVL